MLAVTAVRPCAAGGDRGGQLECERGLAETGIAVERASKAFSVQGKQYPAGSYVVHTAQAFRPHVMDMFEPQVHPDVFPFPGSPPTPPYDNAGWTLAK